MTYSVTDFGTVNLNSYLSDVVGLGTSTEDWTPALQHANNDIVASGQSKTIVIPQDIKLKSTFQWNIQYVSLKGNGIKIHVDINNDQYFAIVGGYLAPSGGTTEPGTTQNPTPSAPAGVTFGADSQATIVFEGIQLIGKPSPTCKGIDFTGDNSGYGAHNISIRESCIQGFIFGLSYENAAYCVSHYNVDIVNNQYGVVSVPGFWNSGERISFTNCNIVNNNNGVYIDNPNADFYFHGCSLDFSNQNAITVKQGIAFFDGCHIENYISDYTQGKYPYIVGDPASGNGATLVIKGGKVTFTNPDPSTTLDYVFMNNASGKGGLVLENIHLFGCITSTGKLVGGNGFTSIRNVFGFDVMDDVLMTQVVNNLLADGSFEQSSVVDDFYLYEDTAPIAAFSQSGTNIGISVSADQAHSGSKSLKLTKNSAGVGSVMLSVPVRKGAFPSAELYYKKDATITGNVSFVIGYYKLNQRGQQTGLVVSGSNSIDLSTISDWTKWSGNSGRIPAWASHFFLLISLGNASAGSLYVDDVVVTEL